MGTEKNGGPTESESETVKKVGTEMGAEWHSTGFKGVRYRKHPTRKHGVSYDKYFSIRYQRDGKRVEEGLGWASEKWTAEKAALTLAEIKNVWKTGKGLSTLKE